MLYQNEQFLVETLTVRHGAIFYEAQDDTVRFRVHFQDIQQIELDSEDEAPVMKFAEDFAFDGLWAVRRDARTKINTGAHVGAPLQNVVESMSTEVNHAYSKFVPHWAVAFCCQLFTFYSIPRIKTLIYEIMCVLD